MGMDSDKIIQIGFFFINYIHSSIHFFIVRQRRPLRVLYIFIIPVNRQASQSFIITSIDTINVRVRCTKISRTDSLMTEEHVICTVFY